MGSTGPKQALAQKYPLIAHGELGGGFGCRVSSLSNATRADRGGFHRTRMHKKLPATQWQWHNDMRLRNGMHVACQSIKLLGIGTHMCARSCSFNCMQCMHIDNELSCYYVVNTIASTHVRV